MPYSPDAARVVAFWRDAGPALWFAKDPAFDTAFRDGFLGLHMRAARRALDDWAADAQGVLALLLLLDQFPRNAFRGTGHMYATDALARVFARHALAARQDHDVEPALRLFLYLPFAHSEDSADQDESVRLSVTLPPPSPGNARRHRDIIRRFGRFPHRNPMLGRTTTPDEQAYLDAGGYAG